MKKNTIPSVYSNWTSELNQTLSGKIVGFKNDLSNKITFIETSPNQFVSALFTSHIKSVLEFTNAQIGDFIQIQFLGNGIINPYQIEVIKSNGQLTLPFC